MHRTITTRTVRRRALAPLTAALILSVVSPAAATDHAFQANPEPEPPTPTVEVQAGPVCDPIAGIAYTITVQDEPEANTSTALQWRDADSAQYLGQHPGAQGLAPTGEGGFEVRGVLHVQNEAGYHRSDWTPVTVDCGGDGEPGPEDPGPEDPVPGDPEIVVGTPTFTG